MPGQISIVGFSGFISKSYVSPFLARVFASDRGADFFRGAAALECGGLARGIVATASTALFPTFIPRAETPLFGNKGSFRQVALFAPRSESVGAPAKFQICREISLIALATRD